METLKATSTLLNMDIKTEPIHDHFIKKEPQHNGYSECFCVSDKLLATNITEPKQENKNECDLNLVQFNVPIQGVVKNIHFVKNLVQPQKPTLNVQMFQQQTKDGLPLFELAPQAISLFGRHLLQSIARGQTNLNLPLGFKLYYIKVGDEIKLLIAQMTVKDGLPIMQRQLIIDSKLNVSFFYGTRHLTHMSVPQKAITCVNCIGSVVKCFNQLKFCKGLSVNVKTEHWNSIVLTDSFPNQNTYRHIRCKIAYETDEADFVQCIHCRYMIVREKKRLRKIMLIKRQRYVPLSMIDNYKYCRSWQIRVGKLKKIIGILHRENSNLRKRLLNLVIANS